MGMSSILFEFVVFQLLSLSEVGEWVLCGRFHVGGHGTVDDHDVVGALLDRTRYSKRIIGTLVRTVNVLFEFGDCAPAYFSQ